MTFNDCDWQKGFLEDLRISGNVSASARSVRKSRASVYRARHGNPEFAAAWQDAFEEAIDRLELEAMRRALEGTEESRFSKGEVIGTVTRYSDNLLMFLLKARRPWLYDRRGLRDGQNDPDETEIEALREDLAERLDRLTSRLAKS